MGMDIEEHVCLPAAFRLFDRMMLLLRGRVVYFGARGTQATDYFKAAPLPEGQMMTSLGEGANEAEWIVDITTQADRQERCALLLLSTSCAHVSMLSCAYLFAFCCLHASFILVLSLIALY